MPPGYEQTSQDRQPAGSGRGWAACKTRFGYPEDERSKRRTVSHHYQGETPPSRRMKTSNSGPYSAIPTNSGIAASKVIKAIYQLPRRSMRAIRQSINLFMASESSQIATTIDRSHTPMYPISLRPKRQMPSWNTPSQRPTDELVQLPRRIRPGVGHDVTL